MLYSKSATEAFTTDDEIHIVTFVDKNTVPGTRGSASDLPGFEVQITSNSLEISYSHYLL